MIKKYKTIIVGAGPAGLIAGRHLENALILDKKKEIGKPVQCAEGISKKALELQGIQPDHSWISSEIHNVKRIMPSGAEIGKFHRETLGYVLDRTAFEKFLANKCKAEIELGEEVVDLKFSNELWTVTTKDNQIFEAKYIIGADGPNSIVRRKVFPENKMKFISTIEYLVKLENKINAEEISFFLDNEKYNSGYTWIFPKSKNTANIGICGKGNFAKSFSEFLENTVKKKYGNYSFLESKSGVISILAVQQNVYKNGAFLTGDAAGFADPIFKGGMTQAMLSAKLVAQCISDEKPDTYESLVRAMPFANPKLIKASEIFYSLDNDTLNELGGILKEKRTSRLKTLPEIVKFLSKPNLRKNSLDLFKLFSVWEKDSDYLW